MSSESSAAADEHSPDALGEAEPQGVLLPPEAAGLGLNPEVPAAENPPRMTPEPSIYNRMFWWAYLANLMLVTANALTFRFAELINLLGGTEQLAGTIVSVGTVAALAGRLFLGQWIDRYGVRPLWLGCSVLYVIGVIGMIGSPQLGLTMYVGRALFAFGLGGMFACSMTHIQNQVPAYRRTEMIASLGSSGFLGMMTGSQLGDLIFMLTPEGMFRYGVLFGCSAGFGVLYLVIVLWLTRHETPRPVHSQVSAFPLLVRYWPGWVMLVAMMLGMGFAGVTVFLTRYATSLGLRGVGTYFTAYAMSAFIIRIMSRNLSRKYGRHRLIVLGLLGHVVGYAGLCFVSQEWHFILPALCSGFAHALLFPCVVSLGTERFPTQYRGTGTTLLLCMIDVGGVVTAPLLGGLIDHVSFQAMFSTIAGAALVTAVLYQFKLGRQFDPETLPLEEQQARTKPTQTDLETPQPDRPGSTRECTTACR